MVQKSELRLGLPVTFTKCYDINPKSRLKSDRGGEAKPIEYHAPTNGIVVGQRNYIMSDWSRYYNGEDVGITGRQRPMLLVATSLYKMPVLVKIEDAEIDMACFYCTEDLHLKIGDNMRFYNGQLTCDECFRLLVELNNEKETGDVK